MGELRIVAYDRVETFAKTLQCGWRAEAVSAWAAGALVASDERGTLLIQGDPVATA